MLPSFLSIDGVVLLDTEAAYGGGFADIYRAEYRGHHVALKRLRTFQTKERHHMHRVTCLNYGL